MSFGSAITGTPLNASRKETLSPCRDHPDHRRMQSGRSPVQIVNRLFVKGARGLIGYRVVFLNVPTEQQLLVTNQAFVTNIRVFTVVVGLPQWQSGVVAFGFKGLNDAKPAASSPTTPTDDSQAPWV